MPWSRTLTRQELVHWVLPAWSFWSCSAVTLTSNRRLWRAKFTQPWAKAPIQDAQSGQCQVEALCAGTMNVSHFLL